MILSIIEKLSKLLKIKGYSKNTIAAYTSHLKLYKQFFEITDWKNHSNKELLNNSFELMNKKEMAYSTQKQFIGSLTLFYKELFTRDIHLNQLKPVHKAKKLPVVLSKNKVKRLFKKTINLKHKAILVTAYSLGLRSGEVLNLKISDLDGDRNVITIYQSKGKKDRQVTFPERLKILLRNYFKAYKPIKFLFEGQKGGKYTQSSISKVFKQAKKRVDISKKATIHTLRHSYATHLLEQGQVFVLYKNSSGINKDYSNLYTCSK